MTEPEEHERIGVLSAGLSGLPVLRECMLLRPDAEYFLLSDGCLLSPPDALGRFGRRVLAAVQDLMDRGATAVVAPGIPMHRALWRGLPASPSRSLEHIVTLEGAAAEKLTRSGKVALVATPQLVASGPYGELLRQDGPISVMACLSSSLPWVLNRGLGRDEITVSAVREVAQAVRATQADVVILACPHGHLVADLFQRLLGPSVAIIPSPRLAASMFSSSQHAEPQTPRVTLISASQDTTVVEHANYYLQSPITGIATVVLPGMVDAEPEPE